MKNTARLARCLCLIALFACTDQGTGPATDSGSAISLRPVFSSSADPADVQRVRVVARDAVSGAELSSTILTVDVAADEWRITVDLPPAGSGQRSIVLTIELLDAAGVVTWSGRTDAITLVPGQTQQQQTVSLFPGPLQNLDVVSVKLGTAPTALLEGDTARLTATVQMQGTGTPRVLWLSRDTLVLRVDTDGGIRAMLPGTTRILARAGMRVDSVTIRVKARPVKIVIAPATATLTSIGAEQAFSASVLDARNVVVDSMVVSWQVAPSSVAILGSTNNRVRAVGAGNATLTATLVGNSAVSGTAAITVAPVPARITLSPSIATIVSKGVVLHIAALVYDAGNSPITGVPLAWTSSNEAVARVDNTGAVTAISDGTTIIQASAGSVSGTATITVQRRAVAMGVAQGDAQTGKVGEALPVVPAFIVLDGGGAGMPGVLVTFTASDGRTAVGSATTDANGIASTGGWTLGSRVGEQTLTATTSVAGIQPVTIRATARAGSAAAIEITGGNNQRARVGTRVANDPTVHVTDRFGNAIVGATVTFSTGVSGGTASPTSATTDDYGYAHTEWTLGSSPGPYSLTASVPGLTGVVFGATAEAPTATSLSAVTSTSISGSAGQVVTQGPTVKALDANGNPVSGVLVTFTVTAGGGSVADPITGASAGTSFTHETGPDGTVGAQWRLGTTAGTNTVVASAPGLSSVTFTATSGVGPAANISIVSGNNQTNYAGWSVEYLTVRVTDAYGNPSAGVSIGWTVMSGGGQACCSTTTTDAAGISELHWWIIGAGTNTIRAALLGPTGSVLGYVTFTATGH